MEEFPDEQAPAAQAVEDNRPLEVRLSDKNWKIRLDAFKDWGALLATSPTPEGFWESSNAVIVSMTGDSNNNVLDAGLDIALSYFEVGDSAILSSIADSVVKNTIDKAFAARSITQAKGKVLVLKVIEMTDPSLCSGALIERLTDKRPKIPPLCLEILAEGMKSFGSTGFPMKDLLKTLPDLFNSSQGPVRDGAMALVLEMLRWVGPRPLTTLVDNLRPAQKTEYERLVQTIDLTVAAIPTVGLKKDQAKLAAAAAVAAAAPTTGKAGAGHFEAVEEEEVDLQKKLKNSLFMDNIRHEKWSEQSQGFQALIDAIGPSTKLKPYPALTDIMPIMKDLLLNGHINVQGKIVKLVSLFVIGLKSKFAVECRSIFPALLVKTKEKRLSDEVGETCGSAFQCAISMEPWLEEICELITSKRQPSHGKICLIQSIELGLSSNRSVAEDGLKSILRSVIACVEESDVQVRQRALLFLKQVTSVFASGNENQRRILQTYEEQFSSAIPQLQAKIDAVAEKSVKETAGTLKVRPSTTATSTNTFVDEIPTKSAGSLPPREPIRPASGGAPRGKASRPTSKGEKKSASSAAVAVESTIDKYSLGFSIKDTFGLVDVETVMTAAIGAESYAAVATLLSDAKWQSKVEALVQIEQLISELASVNSSTLTATYFWVAAATSDLKTTNVNVMKSIVTLFANLFKKLTTAFHTAIPCYLLDVFEDKLSDKKISSMVGDLIEQSCVILGTEAAFQRLTANMERVKAPLAHSAFLDYMKDWISNKGPAGMNVGSIIAFCASEVENKNQAVRSSAINVVVEIYKVIGPQLQLLLNKYPFPPQIRTTIDAECANAKYDPSKAVAATIAGAASSKYDLSTVVDRNLMELLNTVQGKDSWQIRKAALEKLVAACDSRSACFELNPFLLECLKAVKLRLSDTQSNLRPLALVALSKVIASLEVEDAQKAMKHYSTTILTGLDESKKNIRDACIAALDLICLRNGQVQVGILNVFSANCVESIQHSIGKADLLAWLQVHCQVITVESTPLGQALILALLDKNVLVRSHAEEILKVLVEKGLIDTTALTRLVADQAPSNQRALQPIVDRIHLNSPPNIPAVTVTAIAAPQPRVVPREKAAAVPDVATEAPMASITKTVTASAPSVPLLESLPVVGPKSVRLGKQLLEPSTLSKEFIAKFVQDWFGVSVRVDKNVVNSNVFMEKLLLLEIDEKFINQTDMIFRWIGYQFQIIDRDHLERFMVLCTQFLDKVRALPRAFKQHLEAAEVVFFIPQLLGKCSMKLTAVEKQHAHSILSCTSDCFPASSVASQLLLGLTTGSEDCVHICAQELLRIVESVGIMALGRSGLKQVADLAQSPKYSGSESFRLFLVGLQECAQLENLSVNFGNQVVPSVAPSVSKQEPVTVPSTIHRGHAEVNSAPLKLSNQSTAIDVAAVLKRLSTLPVEGANYVVILDLLRSLNERLTAKTEPDVNCHFALGLGCSVWLLKWLRAITDKTSLVTEAMSILNTVFDLRRHITDGNDATLIESINSVLLAVVYATGSIISLHVLVERFTASADEPTALLHILRVISHFAAAKTEQLDPSIPAWSTIIVGLLSMCEQLANTVGEHHDTDRETLTIISGTIKSIEAVCGVDALRDCVTLALFFAPTNALSVFWSEESEGMLSDLDGKINALVREITTSSEKLQPIRQLFNLQRANQDLNIEKHLEKLSVTFRRYVLEEFHRLDAMDQLATSQAVEAPRSSTNDNSMHGADEAMRIIESLKTRPAAITPKADVKTVGGSTPAGEGTFPLTLDRMDSEQSTAGSNLSRRQSKNFGASPFSRRNDKIRDTLANLSKTLELHNFQDSHGANN